MSYMLDYLKDCEGVFYSGKMKEKLDAILNLNELQYPICPRVVESMQRQAPNANSYVYLGDEPTGELIDAIANYVGVGHENIALEEALDQSCNRFPRVFLREGERLVTMSPTYPELAAGTTRAGGKVKKVPLNMPEFTLNADAMLEAIDEKTKIVFICNPNNPTSTSYPREEILKVVENSKCVTVVDECYFEYSRKTVSDTIDEYDNLVVMRSFSKAFGLAGARCAYLIADSELISAYNRILNGFEYNRFGVFGALESLRNLEYYERLWAQIRTERDATISGLRKLGYKVWDSDSEFIFLDVSASGMSSTQLRDYFLEKHRILIRDVPSTFKELEPKYVSFAVGLPEINTRLLEGFKDVITKEV
jgi:histidinol-phosphate aminotransferase